ncbi:hypothetical protein AAE026_09970 [Bradyrhizobium sp. DN5]|uniref:hypothetical protein n=1 Tax=Bradyrhizobium sp. DN5 TaxID=3056950 RepID=UPI003524A43C
MTASHVTSRVICKSHQSPLGSITDVRGNLIDAAVEQDLIGRIAALPLQRFQFGAFEGNRRAATGRRPARAVPAVQNKNCENNPMHSRKPFPARGWTTPGNALTDRNKKAARRNRPGPRTCVAKAATCRSKVP